MGSKRCLAAMSAKNFYGRSVQENESPLQKRIRREVEEREKGKVASHPFYACLTSGDDIWNVYSRQKDAFEYLEKEKEPNLRIFSFESPHGPSGKRHYVVCTAERFWNEYCKLGKRHCYELIMENRPCRLYFDVEFYRHCNPGLDGEKCMEEMIDFVNARLEQQFHVKSAKENVLDLEASTEEKFSRHLVFHLPEKKLFKSNSDAGEFVLKLKEKLAPPAPVSVDSDVVSRSLLWVKNRNGTWTTIWDEAVYSRNRNFRLYLSTKLGHQNPLKTAESSVFYKTKPAANAVFEDSLITVLGAEQSQYLPVERTENSGPSKISTSVVNQKPSKEGCGPSPYPSVDSLLVKILKKRKASAFIRSWKIFENPEAGLLPMVVYEIGNCRYCYNIEREHRSNHVIWIVDLHRHVFYQKCHDPDCRSVGYRSNEFSLDSTVVEEIEKQRREEEVLDDSDLELCRMMDQLERDGII